MGLKDFNDFLREGLIEYLDVNEQINALIALDEAHLGVETTHMEIEPFTILGIVSGLIPYPHHNQSPRNTYQCAMGKQAVGTIGYNQLNRADTLLFLMNYPQRPLVKSKTLEMINFEKLPAGQNASVAVMCYSGYDIEDALILNRASLDRGFARASVIRRNVTTLQQHQMKTESNRDGEIKRGSNVASDSLAPPPKLEPHQIGRMNPMKQKKFKALDADGLAGVSERMDNGDVWINKECPEIDPYTTYSLPGEGGQTPQYKSRPESYKGSLPAYVDRMIIASSPEEPCMIKMI